MKQTKIVATISDQRCDVAFIRSLFKAGMDVARINTAHISRESGKKIIDNIRAVSDAIAIMIDTKGPEIRTCSDQPELKVNKDDLVPIFHKKPESGNEGICVNYHKITEDLSAGSKILIDDGEVEITIIGKHKDHLLGRVENCGTIKKNKSLNIPGLKTDLPSISDRDKDFIAFAVENNLDFIAHSFVRSKTDVLDVQKILYENNSQIKVIAKIENTEGVDHIDEILDQAYGIMIARGDLGIEIPAAQIPTVQRSLIRKSIIHRKPVITATQMLHSMIEHPRPTRAEVSDVAGAIYSGTDAVMLSGETTYGRYPVRAVEVMNKIACEVEPDREKWNEIVTPPVNNEISAYMAHAAIKAAKELKTKCIVTSTTTGKTARYLSAHRPDIPVYAKCYSKSIARELALSFGIFPSFMDMQKNRLKIQKMAVDSLISNDTIQPEDVIIYLGGRFGVYIGASFMEIARADKLMQK